MRSIMSFVRYYGVLIEGFEDDLALLVSIHSIIRFHIPYQLQRS